MHGLRRLADQTPASRERFVDLLRAAAIVAVVYGHWLLVVVEYDDEGRLSGDSALARLPAAAPFTWLFQVLPVFFLVGGYVNAASLASHRQRGGSTADWLSRRAARLLRPTTAFLLVLVAAGVVARWAGVGPGQLRTVMWLVVIPLWFLSAYLAVVLCAPVMVGLHRRFGVAVVAVLVAVVAAGDLARFHGLPVLAYGSFLVGWLAIHQVGVLWWDGRLPGRAHVAVPLLVGGSVMAVGLTVFGPYPVSMINVPGERLHNVSPPSLALLALAAAQLGLVLLLRAPVEARLRRAHRWWLAVVAVNAVVLTVFLWHVTAVVLLAGGLGAAGLLPLAPVGSVGWWAWRVPWLALSTVVLVGLVGVFGVVEARGRRPGGGWRVLPSWLAAGVGRTGLVVVGFVVALAGLSAICLTPRDQPEPVGVPAVAVGGYLVGAVVLRLSGGYRATSPPTATLSGVARR